MNNRFRFIKQITSITLAMAMVLSSTTAFAAGNNRDVARDNANVEAVSATVNNVVPVKDSSGLTVQYLEGTKVRSQSGCKEFVNNMSDGWYVLNGSRNTNDTVVIKGKVNLILADDSYLEAKKGIYITKDSELIIWAQSNKSEGSTGRIKATSESGAGIGSVKDAIGGSLTINGGMIEANGAKYAAGIGGGRGEKSGFGNITINKGFITANGGEYGAAIGRGQRNWTFGTITINGGEVNTKGGYGGAGIGGGEDRGTPNVIINGGNVNADSGANAAGIGGGYYGNQDGKVTINGGTVNALGSPVGIGGGNIGNATFLKAKLNGAEVEINGGYITTNGIGSGVEGTNGPITINGGTVNSKNAYGVAIGADGDQKAPITINGGVVNATMDGTGNLVYRNGAAIGSCQDAGEININGGTVTAISTGGAGIGGAEHKGGVAAAGGHGGNVTITGGNVTAIALGASAGIGGGEKAPGGNVTITGGIVTASSNSADNTITLMGAYGAGSPTAGAAASGASSTMVQMLITGIVMAATSGDVGGAGIGGGYKGNGGNVKIKGGTVIASAKQKGSAAIGKGQGGDNDGSLEIYDDAMVKASNDAKSLSVVEASDRVSACRSNTNAVVTKCDHSDAILMDKNAKVHEVICSHCKANGKTAEEEHHFDEHTHTCACGRTQYKLTAHVVNETVNKDVHQNAKYNKTGGFAYSYEGGVTYVTAGDTLTVSLENKKELQEIELTYNKDGHEEVMKPIEYKTGNDGVITAKYTMPESDADITYTVKNRPIELKASEISNAPRTIKGVVYDGKSHMVVEPGSCKGGTLFYALGEDDTNAPEFDGDINDTLGSHESDRTWKHGVPLVSEVGTYNVWYMIKGSEGYSDTEPVVIQGEIKKVDSVKGKEKTTKGEVNDITDVKKDATAKKQYKTTIEVSNNAYIGEVKFNIEVDGKKMETPKAGDTLEVLEGTKIKVDIPADVIAKKGVQLFYKKKDNLTYTATPKVNKSNEDGSLHVEFEAPGSDSRLVIQFDGSVSQAKKITYEAPTPRSGLIYNGKGQALVKAGYAKGGKLYYALGENATTAPSLEGLSNGSGKVWSVGVPKATESGKYYVWYIIKGDDGYEDISPKCVEVEIGKSAEQKKESVNDGIDDDKDSTLSRVKASSDNKLSDSMDISDEEKDMGVNLWLEEEDITYSLDDYSKMILHNRFSDYEIPVIYDLSLYKKVGDEEPVDITELQKDVELEVDVPGQYVKDGRNFVILRLNEDDPTDITVINPTEFDALHNELTFSTSKICPIAIAFKADEEVINRETTSGTKTPSLISPRAKEGLYYSGNDMELVTSGTALGGTIYYALSNDSNEAPEFDGLSDDKNRTWNTSIPTGKKVGAYNVWYKVIGDEGYCDLDAACVVSEIKEVPGSKYNDVDKEKGKTTNITDHPDVSDNNPNNVKIESDIKPPAPVYPVVDYDDSDDEDDTINYDEEDGINYWLELDDITDTLTDEDVWIIYQQLRQYYIGSLIELSLVMQQGDTTFDITELDEPVTISFEIPEYLRNPGRRYIIYMLEDDGDFYEPNVIRPESIDEANNRITFKTNRIKPFLLGYTDNTNEGDVIVLDEYFDGSKLLSDVKVNSSTVNSTNNNTNVTTSSIPQQSNIKLPGADDNNVVKVDNYQTSDSTTIKVPSAKTGDDFFIYDYVYNLLYYLIHNKACESCMILAK